MPEDSIGVVTLTLRRPDLLRRAMASVNAQDFGGEIEHVIVIDDDPASVPVVDAAPKRPGLRTIAHLVPRPPAEANGSPQGRGQIYPRLSRLFNTGARVSSAKWIAFLDHDNEYEPSHLSSLLACANAKGARAVHSSRSILCADGSPYLDELWHTAPNPEEGARIYELMCDRGVRVRGTNILHDRADPLRSSSFRPSTVIQATDPVFLVDQSAWLIRRDLLLELPIPETFTEEEIEANTAPDDKLLHVLLMNDVPIFSTGLPTLRYYLGGVSNNHRPRQATPASST
jgi:glycosyltransferase involved in cell wall biosynthesis